MLICTVHLTACSYHVTYASQSESTLYIFQNVKELRARNKRDIWSLSDCNGTRTHNYLIHKRTFNHLAKLIKRFSWVVSTCLYGAFDFIFLSCHVRVSVWIYTLYLPEFQELLARKKRDIWSLSDSNVSRTHNHLICKRTLNHLAKITKWLSWVVSAYLYGAFDLIFLSCHVRVSEWMYTICSSMSRTSLLETGAICEI